jgi:hypothetical protein
MRNRLALGCLMASLLVSGLPAAARAQVAALDPIPDTNCTVFPADNIWNTRVDALPVHPKSAVWLDSMQAATTDLHPDFGPPSYGMPFDVVSNRHRLVRITFRYASESDQVRYPFGPKTPIENGSDRHALIVNKSTCTQYEPFDASWNHGHPTAGSGAVFDLSSNALRPDGWTSADAAGPHPARPGSLRRGQGGGHPARHPVHRPVHPEPAPVAGAPRRGDVRSPVPADGRPVPARGGLRPVRVQP